MSSKPAPSLDLSLSRLESANAWMRSGVRALWIELLIVATGSGLILLGIGVGARVPWALGILWVAMAGCGGMLAGLLTAAIWPHWTGLLVYGARARHADDGFELDLHTQDAYVTHPVTYFSRAVEYPDMTILSRSSLRAFLVVPARSITPELERLFHKHLVTVRRRGRIRWWTGALLVCVMFVIAFLASTHMPTEQLASATLPERSIVYSFVGGFGVIMAMAAVGLLLQRAIERRRPEAPWPRAH
jgi:hypothetical protein